MSPALDALSLKFAIAVRNVPGEVVDVGCGDGVATAAALARGAHVFAVDPDPHSLAQLCARVPAEQHRRLRTRIGRIPEIDFKVAGFEAVHVARVLHHLDGEQLRGALGKFFRWIYPRGKLFLSVLTPGGSFWKESHDEFERRRAQGTPWPGYFANAPAGPIHLLDDRTLQRELQAAGFAIQELSCYSLPWDDTQVCCAAIATCDC